MWIVFVAVVIATVITAATSALFIVGGSAHPTSFGAISFVTTAAISASVASSSPA